VCKRERRKTQYARQVGRAPEPVAKPAAGILWRFDQVDACTDAAKKQSLMAALWNDYLGAYFFRDDEALDQAHIDEMDGMPAAERWAFQAAGDAEFAAKQKAARHGYKSSR
jgi:hypothetical protein